MVGFLKRMLGLETPMDVFLRRARHAQDMLKAAGVEVSDTGARLREAAAVHAALGALKLPRNENGRIDPAASFPVLEALGLYSKDMASALKATDEDTAIRTARMSAARRALVAATPIIMTPEIIREIDRALSLPPIDPMLGLQPTEAELKVEPGWLKLRAQLVGHIGLSPDIVDRARRSLMFWHMAGEPFPTSDDDIAVLVGRHHGQMAEQSFLLGLDPANGLRLGGPT